MLAGPCLLRGPASRVATVRLAQLQPVNLQSNSLLGRTVHIARWLGSRRYVCRPDPFPLQVQASTGPQQATPPEPRLVPGSESQLSVHQEKEVQKAKNSAIGSLSWRPHSRKELEDKLHVKGHSKEAIHAALDKLQEVEVQSDADYAECYTRSKWRQSRWAPSRIQQGLTRKGVSKEDCRNALESLFGDPSPGRVNLDYVEDPLSEEQSIHGTEDRVDHQLLESARRKAETTTGLPIEARRRRIHAWLQRRGHDWETANRILTLLQLK